MSGWRRWSHWALALAGVLAVLWALTLGANPTIVCRDRVMHPGETCVNAQGTKVQTYEQRWSDAQWARPVVGGVGVAMAGFAFLLLRSPRRPAS